MPKQTGQSGQVRAVYIVDGARTPFLKAKNEPGLFTGSDLAVLAGRALLQRQPFSPDQLDEVILGCMMPSADEANIARIVSLRLGCGKTVPAWTVQRNCASGLQAIDNAAMDIRSGRHDLVLAGGMDSMSHAPLLYSQAMVKWFSQWMSAKTWQARGKAAVNFRPQYLAPVIALLRGLTDPIAGLNMGQTAENLVYRFGLTRQMLDEYAVQSHLRLAKAYDDKLMNEVVTIYDQKGQYHQEDDGLRRDSSVEKLGKLKPVFDKYYGKVTPGNSSQITDGACVMILASEKAVKEHKLPVLAKIIDAQWAGLEPENMGLGPVHAITPLLQRHQMGLNDVDYFEINEAFAAQVLGCLAAWKDEDYCKTHLGLDKAFGEVDTSRLNVDGGAIALGHPIGASGARVTLHLAQVLRRQNAKYGVASLCIGGGQGGAILIENTKGEVA